MSELETKLSVEALRNVSTVSELKLSRMEQFKLADEGKLENYKENCCFCKGEMTDIYKTHNPYPLNLNNDAVCCKSCSDELLRPARMIMILKQKINKKGYRILSTIVDKIAFPTFEAFIKHELKALEQEERLYS